MYLNVFAYQLVTLFSRRFANIDSAQYMNDMAYSAMSPVSNDFLNSIFLN